MMRFRLVHDFRSRRLTGVLVASMLLLGASSGSTASGLAPSFDEAFMRHWSDGQAELSGYQLTQPRYGQLRTGRAVTVYVKEPFSEKRRVKPDRPAPADTFDVIKLNHIEDFQTGVYDYNLMTSSFVGVSPSGGRPAGAMAKVSFSAQEWCGHAYVQLLFDRKRARLSSHSYFDGEADRLGTLETREDGLVGDALWLWARGMAGPTLSPGQRKQVPYLMTLKRSRLLHRDLDWVTAAVSRASTAETIVVPAGEFVVHQRQVELPDDLRMTFWVEDAFPHRVIKMQASDGTRAELTGTTRQPYWQLSQNGHEKYLKELGFEQP